MEPEKKITILYDGTCSLCSGLVNTLSNSSQKESFNSEDVTTHSLPAGITKEAAEREVHVIGRDGNIYKNVEGILKILEEYPKLGFLVKIGRMKIVQPMLVVVYNFIARHRHFLSSR